MSGSKCGAEVVRRSSEGSKFSWIDGEKGSQSGSLERVGERVMEDESTERQSLPATV